MRDQSNNARLSFSYGDERIYFERTERSSNIRRVLIKVTPNCHIQVQAPRGVSDQEVLRAVKRRSRWICRQLRRFRNQLEYTVLRQYVSGESHYYLGRRYMLKVIEAPNKKPQVKLLRGSLEVLVQQRDAEKIKELLVEWYKERAKVIFASRLEVMLEQALWVDGRPPFRLFNMKTQWGSCSPNGRLTLNPHLVKAPRNCIDYVILHELCHIAEHNHSECFYRLMGQVMPNWETIKTKLDGMSSMLLNEKSFEAVQDSVSR